MAKNTIHSRLKTLKSFLQLAVNEDLILFNPFKKYKKVLSSEDSDVVVFTKEELKELEELDLSGRPFWDRVRDQYILYIWSGVRKGDFKNLLAVVNPTTNCFSFRCEKTGETSVIPAFDAIKRICEKYNYHFPKLVHETIVLREIKKICKLIPSMDVIVEKKYTKQGVTVREHKKKYEMIHIHTARRTLATLLADESGLTY